MIKPWRLVWGHVVHIKLTEDVGIDAIGIGADWQGRFFIKEDESRHRFEFGGLPCESQTFLNSELGRFPDSLRQAPTRSKVPAVMLVDHHPLKRGDAIEVSDWVMWSRYGRDIGVGYSGQRYYSAGSAFCREAWCPAGKLHGMLPLSYFEVMG